MSSDTIVAISSPPGPARRGVLRLSGEATRELVNRALVGAGPQVGIDAGAARGAFRARFSDGVGTQPALVFWMPGPHSYTREDVAELHLPGAEPLLARALARMLELGAVAAAPGEFTRRAFLNGRIDLTRAEGVLELVQATNEAERRAALHLLDGGLDRRMRVLREELDDVRGLCEASLDFDESDTGHVPEDELLTRIDAISLHLDEALAWEVARQPASALPRILLFGAPNSGKSSLFNALVEDGVAIVSDLSGTTRDAVGGFVSIAGTTCLLLDTPGLDAEAARGTGPDATAQKLAERERRGADLVLWVLDASVETDAEALADQGAAFPAEAAVVCVWSKMDLRRGRDERGAARALVAPASCPRDASAVGTALRPGADPSGLAELLAAAGRSLGLGGSTTDGAGRESGHDGDAGGAMSASSPANLHRELFARHRDALAEARRETVRAREELALGTSLDFVAETLRGAGAALDRIVGRTSPEDLLDRIFARFCIGK